MTTTVSFGAEGFEIRITTGMCWDTDKGRLRTIIRAPEIEPEPTAAQMRALAAALVQHADYRDGVQP